MSSTPDSVEVGQIWRDNDGRTRGAGEFTVRSISDVLNFRNQKVRVARVFRHRTEVHTSINVERLLNDRTMRGYTYVGMER